MGLSFPPSGHVTIHFDEPAGFRQACEQHLFRGIYFVPCDEAPPAGTQVILKLEVGPLGAVEFAGLIARTARTPDGAPGVLVAFDPGQDESLAQARALFDLCATAPPWPAAAPLSQPASPGTLPLGLGAQPDALGSSEEALLKEGDLLDNRFRIERHLASGGMGHVYRAMHVFMKRPVALKLLTRALANDVEMSARFQREAELVSQIESPNVVRIFDFGRTSTGILFLAMELVDGVPLEQLMAAQRPFPLARAVPLLVQVCDALAEAHALGIIHRDLKPANIMVARKRDGADLPKVLDFGIARLADSGSRRSGITREGIAIGTPEYIAPEQALAGELDARTDLYSLGVVAFELLTGRLPFVSDSAQKLVSMHLTQAPPEPSALRAELAAYPGLSAAVLTAIRKEKSERFPDVRAFGAALARGFQNKSDQPLAAPARASRPCAHCGVEIDLDSAFCPGCGTSLRDECPQCGVPPARGAAFCQRCGASLAGTGPLVGTPLPMMRPAALAARTQRGPRPSPRALAEALGQLLPTLSPEECQAALQRRERKGAGSAHGLVLVAELVGATSSSEFLGAGNQASLVSGRCAARLVQAAQAHGGTLDALDGDLAVFLFEGEELSLVAEVAVRAALSMRDAVLEERFNLDPGAPLSVRLAVAGGSFEIPKSGLPAEGACVQSARALAAQAPPGIILLGPEVASAVGPRVELRPAPEGIDGDQAVRARPPQVPGSVRLVGRERDLAVLEQLLPLISSGGARPLVVLGAAGSGKSRLAEELAARARRGGSAVAFSRPNRWNTGTPFGALVSLLCDLCGVPERHRSDRLRSALEGLKLPEGELSAALAIASIAPQPFALTPGQAVHALKAVLAAVAQSRTVVLIFDDLDRADRLSLEAFGLLFVAPPPRCLPLGFGLPTLAGLPLAGAAVHPLAPLSPEAVHALVRELLGGQDPEAQLTELLSQRAGTSPPILADWVQLLLERGCLRQDHGSFALVATPPALTHAQLAAARVEALDLLARRVFETGCLLGEVFEAPTVEAALDDPRASGAWNRLERSGLLRALGGRRYQVTSERYHAAARQRADGPGRAGLHQRLARALQAKVLDVGATPPAHEIASHLGLAGNHAEALSWWQRAAEAAVRRRDHRKAAHRLHSWASALLAAGQAGKANPVSSANQRLQALSRGGAQALTAGDLTLARALLDEAAAVQGAERVAVSEYLLCLARLLRSEGRREQATDAIANALRSEPTPALAALCKAELAEQSEARGDLAGARTLFSEALTAAPTAQPLAPWHGEVDLKARMEARLAGVQLQQGDVKSAWAGLQRALEAWQRARHPFAEARLLANLGTLAAQRSKLDDAARLFEAAVAACERCGDLPFKVRLLANLAKVRKLSGDLPGARRRVLDAAELAKALGWPEGVRLAQAVLSP